MNALPCWRAQEDQYRTMRSIIFSIIILILLAACRQEKQSADKIIVLTFDDAVKTHLTFVAPLLQELDFGATFFITHRWMDDTTHFLTWDEVGQLHKMGFEIGNHTWSHKDYALPENAARLAGEISLIEEELKSAGVPKPVSFAYTGNFFGPEAVRVIEARAYQFARRGMQPEVPYGQIKEGPLYDPDQHHPLLIPSAGDAYPNWNLAHFKKVASRARGKKIAVLQFHGVPDLAHEWVSADPELFEACMRYLKDEGYRVIAMKDLGEFISERTLDDPMLSYRHSSQKEIEEQYAVEVSATREKLAAWTSNMFVDHGYSIEEAQQVTQLPPEQLLRIQDSLASVNAVKEMGKLKIRPYPGGRHPRIGFLDGAVDPMRGTKFSVFLPWDPTQYVVVDLPEAIFSNLGLTFLAHRHIPTIWDLQHQFIDNVDWQVNEDGSLENVWKLPNDVSFGARALPFEEEVRMDLWLYNGTGRSLTGLRTQVCVMLKGAGDFNQQDTLNKRFYSNLASVRNSSADRWILTSWDNAGRAWGNAKVPCLHADPQFPDCPPGDTVKLQGVLQFYQGNDVEEIIEQ